MTREIKFRGKDFLGRWHYGHLHLATGSSSLMIQVDSFDSFGVLPETIGQYTGLKDKNGKEIYEGDIVEFYELNTYCINPDCEPWLLGYGSRLVKLTQTVSFEEGSFVVDSGVTLDCLACWSDDDIEQLKNDPYFDANGYDIDSVNCAEVIGNIHDNPELIKTE